MKPLVRAIQRAVERKLRVPSDYLGKMGETSFSGLLKFMFFLPLAVSFAASVLNRDRKNDTLRAKIVEQCGEATLTELSLAIASAQVFPTVKRGMGYAKSCSLIEITTG